MGLAEDVRAEPPYRKFEWVLEQLGDERGEFLELLADPKVVPAAIHRQLRKRGITVTERAVQGWAKDRRESP